jgi:hypothetical protein
MIVEKFCHIILPYLNNKSYKIKLGYILGYIRCFVTDSIKFNDQIVWPCFPGILLRGGLIFC